MKIEVRFEPPFRGVTILWVKRVVSKTLVLEKIKEAKVGVLLTNDRRIRSINKKYLNHDYATDVIAFGLNENELLGDVVVSVEMAKNTARELKIPFKEELARYLVHGTLHLLGYEDKPKEKHDKMHTRQEQILKNIL